MDEICKDIGENKHPSSLLSRERPLIESINVDSGHARLFLQLPILEVKYENDNDDAYIIWLKHEHNAIQESINGINVKIFYSIDEIINFITEIQTYNIFLIVDKILLKNILSFMDNLPQIVFVYVLTNETTYDHVLVTESKATIRKISDNKDELFRFIIEDIDLCAKDALSTTIFDITTEEETTNQMKNPSSVWYSLLIESLLSLTVDKQIAKRDLITYCREQYSIDNHEQQQLITEFENEDLSINAIRWYTRDSFIYRLLNKAFRTRNIDVIFKFRFFITELQNQLEHCYNEKLTETFSTVYRGQQISRLELKKLQNSISKSISTNTYLSASINKDVALIYASDTSAALFQISIDNTPCTENRRVNPVYIQPFSYFSDEQEVLFSVGSTFIVHSVREENNQWNIKLELTSPNNDDQLLNYIQTNYINKLPPTVKFANLLILTGEYEKAERYIKMLIEDLLLSSDNVSIGYAYDLMGELYSKRGDYECALFWFQRALDSIQSDNIFRAKIYVHIGNAHSWRYDNNIALNYYTEALKYNQEMDPFDLASLYEAFGIIYSQMENFDDAVFYLNKALDTYRSNSYNKLAHAFTYIYLALIYERRSDQNKALQFYQDALNILLQKVPKTHPSLAFTYVKIADMYSKNGNNALAMIYCQKGQSITKLIWHEEVLYPNFNPILYIYICIMLENVYRRVHADYGTYLLLLTKEVLHVYTRYEHMIPKTSPVGKIMYNNLGVAYNDIADYNSALKYFTEAFNLPGRSNDQIVLLQNIALNYQNRGDTKMALNYLHDALDFASKLNPSIVDHNILADINCKISNIYKLESNLDKALFFAQESLQLRLDAVKPDFVEIALNYISIADLCLDKTEMCYEKAIDIALKHDLSTINNGWICHKRLGFYFKKQNDLSNALFHLKLALKQLLTINPPCYIDLIDIFENIAKIYYNMKPQDLDHALFYFDKSCNIYLQLLNTKVLLSKDKEKLRMFNGYISVDIQQSSYLTLKILLIYSSIICIYSNRKDHKQILNHYVKAKEIFNAYISEVKPMLLGTIYMTMGTICNYAQNFDEARFYYKKSIEQKFEDYNTYGVTYLSIAETYAKQQNYEMAISNYKISLTFLHNSKSIDHYKLANTYRCAAISYDNMKNYVNAVNFAQQAINHQLLHDPIDYKLVAINYFSFAGYVSRLKPWDNEQAIHYYLRALHLGKNYLEEFWFELSFSLIGICYLESGEYENALKYFNKALEYSKSPSVIYANIRQLYTITGELDKAYEYAKKTIHSELSNTTIDFIDISSRYIAMGIVQYRLGKYKQAFKYYKMAFYFLEIVRCDKTHLNYSSIYNCIGRIYYEYGQLTDALNYCLKARNIYFLIQDDPILLVNIHINLGLIQCKLGHYYVALDYFGYAFEFIYNKKHKFHYLNQILYNYIGYVYFKLGHMKIAMKNYLKSLSFYNISNKHFELGTVYKNIGLIYEQDAHNYPIALSFYKRALGCIQNVKHPHYILYISMIETLELKLKKKPVPNMNSLKK